MTQNNCKNVLLIGGTGFIGSELGIKLVEAGYMVDILTRSPLLYKGTLPYPCRVIEWDYLKSFPRKTSFSKNYELVINLAGESIAKKYWTKNYIKKIRDSRVLLTRNLLEGLKKISRVPKIYIQASAIGFYGNKENENLNEFSPSGLDELASICKDWEEQADLWKDEDCNIIKVRIGIVLGLASGMLSKLIDLYSSCLGVLTGSGQQWLSWIHIDDVCNSLLFLIEKGQNDKIYNLVSPNPIKMCQFHHLMKRWYTTLPGKIPPLVLKIVLGKKSSLILNSQKVYPLALEKIGFIWRYPQMNQALENLLKFENKKNMRHVHMKQWVPGSIEKTWDFFSSESNLEKITPQFLNFKIDNKSTDIIKEKTEINYKLKLHGIPLRWTSKIIEWNRLKKFVDIQKKGPYKIWHHQHTFKKLGSGILITDLVYYQLPFSPLSTLFIGCFVRKDIMKIFNYRKKIIAKLFDNKLL